MVSRPWLVVCHCFKQCRQKLCKHGSCFGSVNMSEQTEQDTSSRRLWSNALISISCSLRNKRVKQGFRGTQLETMKSCDFLFLALLGIVAVYYANVFPCSNHTRNVALRAFVILSRMLIPKNVTLWHSVSARWSAHTACRLYFNFFAFLDRLNLSEKIYQSNTTFLGTFRRKVEW